MFGHLDDAARELGVRTAPISCFYSFQSQDSMGLGLPRLILLAAGKTFVHIAVSCVACQMSV